MARLCGLLGLLTTILLSGCQQQNVSTGPSVFTAWETPAPNETPSAAPKPTGDALSSQPATATDHEPPADAIVAKVGGKPIYRSQLTELLIHSHGLKILEQLILLQLARQRAADLSLSITPADVATEHENALQRIATPIVRPDTPPLDRPAAQRQLEQILRAKNISTREWDLRMETLALLRKIAVAETEQMQISEAMLREQYNLDYAERIQVRHIQLSSLEAARNIRTLLASGKDFELLARQFSENPLTADQGGLLPPFTRHDPAVSPLIREAAFQLQEGAISTTIHEGGVYQILRLERRFPASQVSFEQADPQTLRQRFLDRLIRLRQDELQQELLDTAAISVLDPELNSQYQREHGR
ncbi:MAG: hypothetical protein GXY44_05730 [Phycisphaerales bacterium]|nr:hypothetical protein [Phycisphaerales bacterium]